MSQPIPQRLSQAKIASWWLPRGHAGGDPFEWFATLIGACEDAYMPLRLKQIREAAERERTRSKNPTPPTIKDGEAD